MKDDYRYTGTLFKRSPLVSPTGEGFAAKVRAVVADHARQLQGPAGAMAGKKRTWLPGGILVETWINPYGLAPTVMAKVYFPAGEGGEECEINLNTGWMIWYEPPEGEEDGSDNDFYIFLWPGHEEYVQRGVNYSKLTVDKNGATFSPAAPLDETTYSRRGWRSLSYRTYTDYQPHDGLEEDRADAEAAKEHLQWYDRPHLYSGLARLFIQSLIGSGRSLFDLFSEADVNKFLWHNRRVSPSKPETPHVNEVAYHNIYEATSRYVGCVRSPSHDYWLVHVSILGAFAWKLVFNDCVRDLLLQQIFSDSEILTREDRIWFEGWLLSSVVGLGPRLTLLEPDDEQITNMFATEEPDDLEVPKFIQLQPWGWCWRYQYVGEADEDLCGAVAMRYHFMLEAPVDNGFGVPRKRTYTAECKLDITFDEETGVPIAEITQGENNIYAGYCAIMYPDMGIKSYNGVTADITPGSLQIVFGGITDPSDFEPITVVPADIISTSTAAYMPDGEIAYIRRGPGIYGNWEILGHTYPMLDTGTGSSIDTVATDKWVYRDTYTNIWRGACRILGGGEFDVTTFSNEVNLIGPVMLSESPGVAWALATEKDGSTGGGTAWIGPIYPRLVIDGEEARDEEEAWIYAARMCEAWRDVDMHWGRQQYLDYVQSYFVITVTPYGKYEEEHDMTHFTDPDGPRVRYSPLTLSFKFWELDYDNNPSTTQGTLQRLWIMTQPEYEPAGWSPPWGAV